MNTGQEPGSGAVSNGIVVIPDRPRLLADWSECEVQMDKPLSADRCSTAARRADQGSLYGEAAHG
jgi:hypothetical protein